MKEIKSQHIHKILSKRQAAVWNFLGKDFTRWGSRDSSSPLFPKEIPAVFFNTPRRKEPAGTARREINESLENMIRAVKILANPGTGEKCKSDCLVCLEANIDIIREFNNNPNEED